MATLAEHMQIAHCFIAFSPQMLPSGFHPSPFFKHQDFPAWVNRLSWQIVAWLDKFNFTRLINRKRAQLGLKPVADAWRHVMGTNVIVASDRAISEVPPDVDVPGLKQTGYMHLRQPDQDRELPELEDFLAKGTPPVYAGFGSMPRQDQIRLLSTVVEGVRLSGQRAVISKFSQAPAAYRHSEDIFFIQKYPHLKLFPRMAAVVHHGGAGTTAAGAYCGVAQIIVPHILDQYYWGRQIYRTHLGPKPIWRAKLSARKLAAAIQDGLENHHIRTCAEKTAREIRRNDGLEATVRAVLNFT
jgi:UDP:flavonoid glycosyltransferase YjiC (YdhE family)